MQIDRETLYKLAQLARLEINPEEEATLLKDLSNMITFVEKLKEVDTAGVEPLTTMSQEVNSLRADEVGPHLSKAEAMQNAPLSDPDYFRVPKVLE